MRGRLFSRGKNIKEIVFDRYDRVVDANLGSSKLLNLTYNADDSIATKKYCVSGGTANSTMYYTYNTRGFVSKVRGTNSAGTTILNLNYNYTKDGNVAYINDTAGTAGVEQYWYDQLGRLTKAQATSTFGIIMYGYSDVGNRIWKNEGGSNLTYNYGTYSKLTSNGSYSYAYDADGNVVWKNVTNSVRYNYLYNSFGQMTEVKKQLYSGGSWGTLATIAKYYYDANGARAKTDEGGTVFRYVYSGHDPIYYNGTDGKGHKDLYLGGRLEVRVVSASEKWTYMADALGSTRKVLSNGQASTATFTAVTYKPFGAVVTVTGGDKLTYAGEMLDPPTGLIYLSARYYDPQLGRFYALDPELGRVSQPQTLNRYVYCANSPLIHTDPTGRSIGILILGFMIAGGIAGFIDAYENHDSYGACITAGVISWGTFQFIDEACGLGNPMLGMIVGIPVVRGEYTGLKEFFKYKDPARAYFKAQESAAEGLAAAAIIFGFRPYIYPENPELEFFVNAVGRGYIVQAGIAFFKWMHDHYWPKPLPRDPNGQSMLSADPHPSYSSSYWIGIQVKRFSYNGDAT
jgi:RHS repeat-associated protein